MGSVANGERAYVHASSWLRKTAYHMVEASSGPWIGCQGRSGGPLSVASPASMSWRSVEI